jgi:hypothetical protein
MTLPGPSFPGPSVPGSGRSPPPPPRSEAERLVVIAKVKFNAENYDFCNTLFESYLCESGFRHEN